MSAALPNASILVMSPMDRGQKNGGQIETLPTIPRIVDIQRRVAAHLDDSQSRLVSADFIYKLRQVLNRNAVAEAR